MRIVASVALLAFSVATAPVLADELEWGPLSTQPKDNQNSARGLSPIWMACLLAQPHEIEQCGSDLPGRFHEIQ
jgi:hypothetical protein